MDESQPEFDRVAYRKKLSKLLQESDIDPDCAAHLDEHFVGLLGAKRLLQVSALPSLKQLKSGAEELDELSSTLARRMYFDSDEERAVFTPALIELLSDAFDKRVLEQKHLTSIDPNDCKHHGQDAIKGWYTGQWGIWCQRLTADLLLLKDLTAMVQQRLIEERAVVPASPAMTEEDLVLEIHALLSQFFPKGKSAKTVEKLIADIMATYHLDAPADSAVKGGITTDKVRGILRKHNKVGVSR